VVGPDVNVSRRADGSWAGWLQGDVVDVTVVSNRMVGAGLDVEMTPRAGGDGVLILGQWQGRLVRFELSEKEVAARVPGRSFNLRRVEHGVFGPQGELKLSGEALALRPPFPQIAFALLGAVMLPGTATPSGRTPRGY
jgi:hypothetical protein